MLVQNIEYEDYNGEKRKEDFYFNLTEAELMEMEMSTNEQMSNMIERIIKTNDKPEIMRIFKNLIMKAYGEKSLDGKRFIKSEEISTAFVQTEAYNELVLKMFEDAGFAADFFKGIMPKKLTDTKEFKEAEKDLLNK